MVGNIIWHACILFRNRKSKKMRHLQFYMCNNALGADGRTTKVPPCSQQKSNILGYILGYQPSKIDSSPPSVSLLEYDTN